MGLEDLRKNLAVKKASSQTSRDAWHDGMVVDPLFASAALYAVKNGSVSLADLTSNFHIDSIRSNSILTQLKDYHVIFFNGKKWLSCMPKDMLETYLVRYVRLHQVVPGQEPYVSDPYVAEDDSKSQVKNVVSTTTLDSHNQNSHLSEMNVSEHVVNQKTDSVSDVSVNKSDTSGLGFVRLGRDILEEIRQKELAKWAVSEDEWKHRLTCLDRISAYFPAVVKWCSTAKTLNPRDCRKIGVSAKDLSDCVYQMKDIGLLNSQELIRDVYQDQLFLIAGYGYSECLRRNKKLPPDAVLLYASKNVSKKLSNVGLDSDYGWRPINDSDYGLIENQPPELLPVSQVNVNELPSWSDVQKMTGVQFENYCMELLRLNGFTNVHGTVTSGDGGVDILAKKSNELYAIQCKRWKGSVGYKAVQEIFAGKSLEGADKAVVMTNSHFSQPAHENAKKLGVILWDGKYVQSMANVVTTTNSIAKSSPAKKPSVLSQVVSAFKDVTRIPSIFIDYGSVVTVRINGELQAYTLVSSADADINKSRISDTSPIGAALMGHQSGDVVVANTPGGNIKIEIVAVDN